MMILISLGCVIGIRYIIIVGMRKMLLLLLLILLVEQGVGDSFVTFQCSPAGEGNRQTTVNGGGIK